MTPNLLGQGCVPQPQCVTLHAHARIYDLLRHGEELLMRSEKAEKLKAEAEATARALAEHGLGELRGLNFCGGRATG
eukprot:5334357-Alexandrium_andersonii.AAC.1